MREPFLMRPRGLLRSDWSGCRVWLVLALLGRPGFASGEGDDLPPCPRKTDGLRSTQGQKKVHLDLYNRLSTAIEVYWITRDSEEAFIERVEPGHTLNQESWDGHAFRIYTAENPRKFLQEHVVKGSVRRGDWWTEAIQLRACGMTYEQDVASRRARDEEFQSLAEGADSQCEPPGQSHLWSCVRRIPRLECEKMHRNEFDESDGHVLPKFGFAVPQGPRPKGAVEDFSYEGRPANIPRLTEGPGFLKMNMTSRLRDLLLPWYHEQVAKGGIETEENDGGNFLNEESVSLQIVSLDNALDLRNKVSDEIQSFLEWWTDRPLQHHATFGARIYRRGAVLLNHVDTQDTHWASAVLQVAQEVDEDGGWPLEILSPDRDCYEVYLRPGQVVLYEGALFKHGRPMAFRGASFANVFSHFTPMQETYSHSEL
eukprot:TRINITY_DN26304_c0_g1_i1.p1 TRINITY_DN26304_c0_g1~~TRINITY_DN26304_c0_g1_i1.p1  ORF type:complete len:427 (-),score=46.28 TRINITY_DN26304_c0_g1_i1:2-1282(-)